MPFKSKSQMRACFAKKSRGAAEGWDCEEWADKTTFSKLPEKTSSDPISLLAADVGVPRIALISLANSVGLLPQEMAKQAYDDPASFNKLLDIAVGLEKQAKPFGLASLGIDDVARGIGSASKGVGKGVGKGIEAVGKGIGAVGKGLYGLPTAAKVTATGGLATLAGGGVLAKKLLAADPIQATLDNMETVAPKPPSALIAPDTVDSIKEIGRQALDTGKGAVTSIKDKFMNMDPKLRALLLGGAAVGAGYGTYRYAKRKKKQAADDFKISPSMEALAAILGNASLGSGVGGALGSVAGNVRGNTPEGLGRGLIRGGITGGGAGLGGLLGHGLGKGLGADPSMSALIGAGVGGLGGWAGSGKLIGKPAGKRKKEDDDVNKTSNDKYVLSVARRAVTTKIASLQQKCAVELLTNYLDALTPRLSLEKQASVRALQMGLANRQPLSIAIKQAYPQLSGEQRGILATRLVKAAADCFNRATKEAAPRRRPGRDAAPPLEQVVEPHRQSELAKQQALQQAATEGGATVGGRVGGLSGGFAGAAGGLGGGMAAMGGKVRGGGRRGLLTSLAGILGGGILGGGIGGSIGHGIGRFGGGALAGGPPALPGFMNSPATSATAQQILQHLQAQRAKGANAVMGYGNNGTAGMGAGNNMPIQEPMSMTGPASTAQSMMGKMAQEGLYPKA